MKKQGVNTTMTDELHPADPNRKKDGTFAEGNNANPEGNNGHLKGWQRYDTRLQTWLEKPIEEIQKLTVEELQKRPLIDVVCIQHAKDMMDDNFDIRHRSREAAVDRIDGKAKQTHKVAGDPDNKTPISMDGVFTLTFGTEDNESTTTDEPVKPTA